MHSFFVDRPPDCEGHILRRHPHAHGIEGPGLNPTQHGGVHKRGHDVAHADAVTGPLHVEGLGESPHPELARAVGAELGSAVKGRGRAHVHHHRAFRVPQPGKGLMGAVHDPLHVDACDVPVDLRRQGLERPGPEQSGGVEKGMDLPVAPFREVGERGLYFRYRCHVESLITGLILAQFACKFPEPFFVHVVRK